MDEALSAEVARPNPVALALGCARIGLGMLSIATSAAGRALERAIGTGAVPAPTETAGRRPSRGSRVPGVDAALRSIREERARNEEAAARFFAALLPEVTETLLNNLDLTEIVVRRVDIDRVIEKADIEAVVRRVDLDAVATRLDIDAIIDRVDLVGMARYLMDELEVPEIIRESTGALAAESIEQLRIQGIRADRFVSHLLDRIVRRGIDRKLTGPADTGGASAIAPGSSG